MSLGMSSMLSLNSSFKLRLFSKASIKAGSKNKFATNPVNKVVPVNQPKAMVPLKSLRAKIIKPAESLPQTKIDELKVL